MNKIFTKLKKRIIKSQICALKVVDCNVNYFLVSRVFIRITIKCQHENWFDHAINFARCNNVKLLESKQFFKVYSMTECYQ